MAGLDAAEIYAREIVTTRVFDAPRALVWRAWSEPEHLAAWWGPKGFRNSIHAFEFRPGGAFRLTMHGPDGTDYPNELLFVETVKPERLVIDHVSMPKFRLTVMFEDLGGRTKISFRQLFETAETYAAIKGIAMPANEQIFDKLAEVLAALRGGHAKAL